jgi:cytochrome c oxidase subunit I+III
VQVFSWLATLLTGRPRLELPMLWLFGFFFVFVAGGLTGVMVAVVPFDWQAHDTHFVVAHLHYVLIGGFVFPAVAGLYYWLPQVTGRRSDRGLGKLAFWLVFIGMNLTFLVMHWTGLLGMPRRVFTYAPGLGWEWPNLISSAGGFVMAIGFAMVALDVLVQWRFAPHAPHNPWRASTLEWAMPTPVPPYNIASLPEVTSRAPLHDDPRLGATLAAGGGYLAGVRNDWRETLGVEGLSGKPEQIILLPGPTYLPLITALFIGGFFLCFLFSQYAAALVFAVLVLGAALLWLWGTGLKQDPDPQDVGHSLKLLPHAATDRPIGWWGMVFTLAADGSLFAHLIFGALFLWVIAPGWPPPSLMQPNLLAAVVPAIALVAGWVGVSRAERSLRDGEVHGTAPAFLLTATAGVIATCGFVAVPLWLAPPATEHAYGAVLTALSAYGAFHAFLATVGSAYAYLRVRSGYVSAMRSQDVRIPALLWRFSAITGLILLALIHGLSLASLR